MSQPSLLLAPLRQSPIHSGEASSIRFHQHVLTERLGITLKTVTGERRPTGRPGGLVDLTVTAISSLRQHRQALRADPDMAVVWFIPTLAQIGLVRWVMTGLPNPAGVFVEGTSLTEHGDLARTARKMPFYVLMRAILANDRLGRAGAGRRRFPLAVASHWQLERIQRVFPDTVVVRVPNGSPNMPLRPVWKAPEQPRLRVMGHGLFNKGIDVALDATARARQQVPALGLDWAHSRMRADLLDRARQTPWVTLYGGVNPYEFMATGSIVLVPLRLSAGTNVYPNTLVEAMASGSPVLTSDLPCHRELLGPAAEQAIVSSYDPAAWSERIVELIQDRAAIERLSRTLIDRARCIFDGDRIAASWRTLLDAIEATRQHGQ